MRERLRPSPLSALQRENIRPECGDGCGLRRDHTGSESEGRHGWAPTALTRLQGPSRAVVVEPRVDLPTSTSRQRPSWGEGEERRDAGARFPTGGHAVVAGTQVVDHRAPEGGRAIIRRRHAGGADIWEPGEHSHHRQRGQQGPPVASPPKAQRDRARGEGVRGTTGPEGRGGRGGKRMGPWRCPRRATPGCAGGRQ